MASRPEYQFADPEAPKPLGSERAFLQRREGRLAIDEKRDEVVVVTDPDGMNNGAGWFCEICQASFKDSLGYISHVNGKKHQRKLGYSMRVQKSTAEDVRRKLEEQKEKDRKARSDKKRNRTALEEHEERVIDLINQEQELKALKKQRREERREERKKQEAAEEMREERKKQEAAEEMEGMDPEMAALMGFSSFS